MRVILLDSGPLGMLANPRARPKNVQCEQWVIRMLKPGVRIVVPEICDYEVRRKLINKRGVIGS